jgi:hypothetical protein
MADLKLRRVVVDKNLDLFRTPEVLKSYVKSEEISVSIFCMYNQCIIIILIYVYV